MKKIIKRILLGIIVGVVLLLFLSKVNHEATLEDGITIYIRDTGDKISEGLVEHIFEPFVMGDSARKAGGNGLGLSIAARIVKLHHGQIELEQKEESQYTKSFVIRFRV